MNANEVGRYATLLIAVIIAPRPSIAQAPPITREFRVDGIAARHPAIESGASLVIASGIYVRNALTVAGGITGRDSESSAVGRVEFVSRFLLDPFRESSYGLSVGGGFGVTNLAHVARWRPYLAGVLDVELKSSPGLTPAIQLGLGGGARLGLVLRSGSDRRR